MESSSRAFKWDQSERSQFFRYKVKAVFVKGLFSKGEVRGSNQGGADQVSVNFINLWSSNTTRLLEIAMHHFFWDTLYKKSDLRLKRWCKNRQMRLPLKLARNIGFHYALNEAISICPSWFWVKLDRKVGEGLHCRFHTFYVVFLFTKILLNNLSVNPKSL